MSPAIHHLALFVVDLARAEQFYTAVLGLPVLRRWPSADGEGERAVWLDLGQGAFLALERVTPKPDELPRNSTLPGYQVLALSIPKEERELWRERIAAHGQGVSHETAYTLYFTDPEGNRLGLSHWPEPHHS